MSKVTKIIAYSNKPLDFLKDQNHVTYANPQFFSKPVIGAEYFWSDKPHIIDAYEKRGVPMFPMIKEGTTGYSEPLPADWREYKWQKMRSLASKYTEQNVKDKTMAEQTLEEAEKLYGVVEEVEQVVTPADEIVEVGGVTTDGELEQVSEEIVTTDEETTEY